MFGTLVIGGVLLFVRNFGIKGHFLMTWTAEQMPRRRFGRTELQMPVLTCGGMRYQQSWGDDLTMTEIDRAGQANIEATIHRALELGINHIETARGYGTSEMQLGEILPTLPRDQMIVQTKVEPSPDPAKFLADFETSMNFLGLEHVELLGLHGINTPEILEWSIRPGGCLDAASELQKQGRVGHIGFSTHGSRQLVREAINTGRFDYVNLHWYFVNDLNSAAIDDAASHDMGVFIISPNDKGGKLYEPPPRLSELCEPLSPMVFNTLYCLAREQVHTLSMGAACPEDFDEHIKAVKQIDRAAELSAPIAERLRAEIAKVCGSDWNECWVTGLPDPEDLPNQVNVQEIVRLWTYAKALDMVSFGKMRYNLLGSAGHWFPGQHLGHLKDMPELINCLSDSPYQDKIEGILNEAHELLLDAPVVRLSESE